MKRIAPEWNSILIQCQVKPITAAIWSEVFAAVIGVNTFSAGDEDLRNFLGQLLVETSMLEKLEENLNYSAERLMVVWPRRFPRLADALPYAHSPEALANRVYGGRMGNTEPGDGWKYRGSGIPMVTGKDNYRVVQAATGLPVVAKPELLRSPLAALQAGVAWWERRVPDVDLDDPEKVTHDVQGGAEALVLRTKMTELATEALA